MHRSGNTAETRWRDVPTAPASAAHLVAPVIADRAFAPTIANAASHPFYSEHWRKFDVARVTTAEDLPMLPTIGRQHMGQLFDASTSHAAPASVVHTSGTTGRLVLRGRGHEEVEAFALFFRHLCGGRDGQPAVDGEKTPLALSVVASNHGHTGPSGLPFHFTAIGYNAEVVDQCVQLLTTRFSIAGYSERIVILSCDFFMLKHLTAALLREGTNPADVGVRDIVVSGDYVEPREHALFADLWHARLADRYSCAEVVGGATRCWRCHCYGFDPMLIVEILDPVTGLPAPNAAGLITLSELYPFSIYQPMIRYQNGDLFEWVDEPCGCRHGRGLRYVGRHAQAPVFRDGRLVAYPVELERALNALPQLCRRMSSDMPHDCFSQDFGEIRGRIRLEEPASGPARLTVELAPKFVPALFPEATRELRAAVAVRLAAESATLDRYLNNGTVVLDIIFDVALANDAELFPR